MKGFDIFNSTSVKFVFSTIWLCNASPCHPKKMSHDLLDKKHQSPFLFFVMLILIINQTNHSSYKMELKQMPWMNLKGLLLIGENNGHPPIIGFLSLLW